VGTLPALLKASLLVSFVTGAVVDNLFSWKFQLDRDWHILKWDNGWKSVNRQDRRRWSVSCGWHFPVRLVYLVTEQSRNINVNYKNMHYLHLALHLIAVTIVGNVWKKLAEGNILV
jgi:hypothetical protein